MRKLTILFSGLYFILIASCTTKQTIINNYYTTSSIDSSWVVITDPYEATHGQLFITQENGLLLINNNQGYKSNDGGKTWSKFTMDSTLTCFIIYEGKNSILYYSGHISGLSDHSEAKSTDNGNTWAKIIYPSIDTAGKNYLTVKSFDVSKNGDLFMVYFWQPRSAGNISDDGLIFRSTDDGNTWSMVKNGNDSLNHIRIIKTGCKNNIYANQYYYDTTTKSVRQRIMFSNDNGYNWQTGLENYITNNLFYPDSLGNIYSYNLSVEKSKDNGNTFNSLNYRFYGYITKLAFSKNGYIFCSTSYGLYYSKDNGNDWQPLIENEGGISDLAVSPDGYVYIRDDNYILHRSKQPIAK